MLGSSEEGSVIRRGRRLAENCGWFQLPPAMISRLAARGGNTARSAAIEAERVAFDLVRLVVAKSGAGQTEHDRVRGDQALGWVGTQRVQTLAIFEAVGGRAIGVM